MARISRLILVALVVLSAAALAGPAEMKTMPARLDKAALDRQAVAQRSNLPGIYQAGKGLLNEGFEGTTFPPDGWRVVNQDGGTNQWVRYTTNPHSGTACAACTYQSTNNDDWLITPPLYPQSADDSIKWWLRAQSTSYNDSMQLWISTTDSLPASFSYVASYSNAVTTYAQKSATLAPYINQRIFVAFVYRAYDMWRIYIDDVTGPELTQPSFALDVKVQSIDTPATVIVPPGVAFQPSITVKNVGTSIVPAFQTSCHIYDSTGTDVWNFNAWPGDSIGPDSVVHFVIGVPFSPVALMQYQMVVSTELPGDLRPMNDTMKFNFRTYDRNVGTTAIVAPAGTIVAQTANVTPTATFHNFATEAATFDAYFEIDFGGGPVYLENATIADLAPGADTTIAFPDWTAPHDLGIHRVYAYAYQELDLNPANDTIAKTITVEPNWSDTLVNESFEGTFPPAGWDTLKLGGDSCWMQSTDYHHNGTFAARLPWGYNLDMWLRTVPTKSLNFTTLGAAKLIFWWNSSYYWHVNPNDNGDLFVQASVDNGTTWDTLWTFGDSVAVTGSGGPWPWVNWTWYQAAIDLSAYAGQSNVMVAFHVIANDNADIAVDDVMILGAPPLGITSRPVGAAPAESFKLLPSCPNPFHGSTQISFQLPQAGRVNLAVYSITGQLVRTLVSESRPAGHHTATWNGKDNSGRSVSSGIYFYRLNAGANSATGKLVMIR